MATTVRTDEHREGVLVPANYKFVDVLDLYAGSGKDDVTSIVSAAQVPAAWVSFSQRMRAAVRRYQARATGERLSLSQCSICGAHIRYAVVWSYLPTGENELYKGYVTTGMDCAASMGSAQISEISEKAGALKEFVAGMRRQARDAEKAATAAPAPAEAVQRWSGVDATRLAWIREDPEHKRVAHFLHAVSVVHAENGCAGCFFCSLAEDLVIRGTLTGRQVNAVTRSLVSWETSGRIPEVKAVIPSGTTTVMGDVVSIKGYREQRQRMLVQCNGYRVWSDVPREILNRISSGRTVRFVAELSASERDGAFLIGSKPRDAEIVG